MTLFVILVGSMKDSSRVRYPFAPRQADSFVEASIRIRSSNSVRRSSSFQRCWNRVSYSIQRSQMVCLRMVLYKCFLWSNADCYPHLSEPCDSLRLLCNHRSSYPSGLKTWFLNSHLDSALTDALKIYQISQKQQKCTRWMPFITFHMWPWQTLSCFAFESSLQTWWLQEAISLEFP